MAKPCRIADTVCVQPDREVIVSILVRECLPKGCPRIRPVRQSEFLSERPPRRAVRVIRPVRPSEGLSERPPGGLSEDPSGETVRVSVREASRRAIRVIRPSELSEGDTSSRLGGCKILAVGICTDDLHRLYFRYATSW